MKWISQLIVHSEPCSMIDNALISSRFVTLTEVIRVHLCYQWLKPSGVESLVPFRCHVERRASVEGLICHYRPYFGGYQSKRTARFWAGLRKLAVCGGKTQPLGREWLP